MYGAETCPRSKPGISKLLSPEIVGCEAVYSWQIGTDVSEKPELTFLCPDMAGSRFSGTSRKQLR